MEDRKAEETAAHESDGGKWPQPKALAAVAVTVVVAVLVWWWLTRGGVRESDLDLLPANSSLVLVVDVGEVYESPLGETIRSAFAGPYRELEDEMRSELGFGPDQVAHLVLGGDPAVRMPCVLVVMKRSLDEDEVARVVRAAHLDPEPREVGGRRMWGGERDRMALGLVRSDALLFGIPGDVKSALVGTIRRSRAAGLLADEGGLDASAAVVFDWTAVALVRRDLERAFDEAAPLLFKHGGPIVATMQVDDGVQVEAKLLDARAERVHARYFAEVDGEFLQDLLTDLGHLLPARRRRPRIVDRPPVVVPERSAVPEPASPRSR